MKVYYVKLTKYKTVGCLCKDKLRRLHPEYTQKETTLFEFKGHLYGKEWCDKK